MEQGVAPFFIFRRLLPPQKNQRVPGHIFTLLQNTYSPLSSSKASFAILTFLTFVCFLHRMILYLGHVRGRRQSKKQTAWKKSRTFGDLKGGRMRVKLKDNILRKLHSLQCPSPLDECPIYMQENPSKDFYFPITVDDIKSVLEQLPTEDVAPLTHIWLRKKNPYNNHDQREFIVGSGVYVIILYPFSKNNKLMIGKKKPTNRQLTWYKG